MTMNHAQLKRMIGSMALATALATAPGAYGAANTWEGDDGGSPTDFNLGANWSLGVVSATDVSTFTGAASVQPNVTANVTVSALNFSTAASSGYIVSATSPAALTLTSTLSAVGTAAISSQNTSGVNTVSSDLVLAGTGKTFIQAPGGELVVSGDISESGGAVALTLNRTAAGGHTITLSGNNSYSGGTNLSGAGGKLNIGSATAIGTGTLTLVTSTHTIDNTSGGAMTLSNALTLNNATFNFSGSNDLTFTGAVTLSGTSTRNINVTAKTLRLTNSVTQPTGPVNIAQGGAGTLIFDGSSNHTGTTTAGGGGTFIVNGDWTSATGNVTVTGSGATLGGTGIIGGSTTVSSGGRVSPGNSPGTLTFNQNLTFNNNSNLVFEAGDLVDVNGILTLTDNWNLLLGPGFQDGGSVTVFTYGTLTGGADLAPTFNTTNLGFTPSGSLTLTDTGTSIVLNGISLIPEPGSLALLAAGTLCLGVRSRRRVM